jgi:hypothetical protein
VDFRFGEAAVNVVPPLRTARVRARDSRPALAATI